MPGPCLWISPRPSTACSPTSSAPNCKVDPHMILWILDFLLKRDQFARVNSCTSPVMLTSTGSPQGTVISPVLFLLCTNNLKGLDRVSMAVKFADDIALVDTSNSPVHFEKEAKELYQRCEEHFFWINVRKKKAGGGRRKADPVLHSTERHAESFLIHSLLKLKSTVSHCFTLVCIPFSE